MTSMRTMGILVAAALVACSGTSDVVGLDDRDAGVAARDGGEAEVIRDAGEAPTNAGAERDGGEATDGGVNRDGGEARNDAGASFLKTWFADYNAGQGTDYLDAPYTTLANGDPRYANDAPHVYREDVPYGPFPRNVLDVWQVDSSTPTPVLVFIHGGGFQGGDKSQVNQNPNLVRGILSQGVSLVSINYRWAYRDPNDAVLAPVPNDEGTVHDVNGTRLDYILRDCARAIQYIRYRAAEWNIDPNRIAAWGGSAGAGCATWTGAVEDLAVEDHADPVLRASTRLQAIGHTNGQPTYHWLRWPELLELDEAFVFGHVEGEAVRLTQKSLADLRGTQEGQDLGRVLDYYDHLDAGDPPFITQNQSPDRDETTITNASEVIHHPRAHVALYRRCEAAGNDCEINTRIERSEYRGNVIQYLIEAVTR